MPAPDSLPPSAARTLKLECDAPGCFQFNVITLQPGQTVESVRDAVGASSGWAIVAYPGGFAARCPAHARAPRP